MKKCGTCKELKPLDAFYNSKSSKDGKGYRCKPCDDAARKSARANSPGTWLGNRRRHLSKTFGLTVEAYEAMLEQQGSACDICRTKNPAGEGNTPRKRMSFAVDHCHETERVRGLLCNTCNRGLGFFRDDLMLVKRAAQYLEVHGKSQN